MAIANILVVDDETDLEILILQKFRKKIRDGEYSFLFARNGVEALNILKNNANIDLIVSDINMPQMDGLTLLQHVKELDNPILKTLIVSAYGDMANIRAAMNRGAFDFVTKPVDFRDLETTIEKTLDSIKMIKEAINLKQQVSEYKTELEAAREIQLSILPKNNSLSCEKNKANAPQKFEIYANMIAAEQVGGDFFDYFLIDDNLLGFVIGDVSGKGVPSAIFMAVARTLIRAYGIAGYTPAECLALTNSILCDENTNSMFVTVFYGILDPSTGRVSFTNAGHLYPYVIRRKSNSTNNLLESIDYDSSMLLGAFEDAKFTTSSFKLEQGDMLVLYTDGVTEAMNPDKKMLGEEKLENLLSNIDKSSGAETIVHEIFKLVDDFSNGASRSDDTTVLAVKYI